MNELLIPVPKTSLEKLLKPVNRLTESCVLKSVSDKLYTICSSDDNSVILIAQTGLPVEIKDLNLNLINIKKLLTGLDCLGDDGLFKMIKNQNHIICKSENDSNGENTHFKYHLVDDNIIKESTVTVESIKKIGFDTSFDIPVSKLKQIMSAYSFTSDVNKIYFYTKDDKVYADIDDKTLDNLDTVSMLINNSYDGQPISTPLALKIEVFKNLASSKNPVKVRVTNSGNVKLFIFNIQEDDNTELKYLISALVK
jgi:hypothetical protein